MVTILLGLALTTVLLTACIRRSGSRMTDLGSMSTNWISASRAGERHTSL